MFLVALLPTAVACAVAVGILSCVIHPKPRKTPPPASADGTAPDLAS